MQPPTFRPTHSHWITARKTTDVSLSMQPRLCWLVRTYIIQVITDRRTRAAPSRRPSTLLRTSLTMADMNWKPNMPTSSCQLVRRMPATALTTLGKQPSRVSTTTMADGRATSQRRLSSTSSSPLLLTTTAMQTVTCSRFILVLATSVQQV